MRQRPAGGNLHRGRGATAWGREEGGDATVKDVESRPARWWAGATSEEAEARSRMGSHYLGKRPRPANQSQSLYQKRR